MTPTSREIGLWIASAFAVFAAHAGLVAALSTWSDRADPGGAASAILIEMAPIAAESAAEHANLPIAPLQEVQAEPDQTPEAQKDPDKVDPEPERKLPDVKPAEEAPPPLPPTPPVTAEVVLPPEGPKVEQKPLPPRKNVAVATAPERAERVAPRQRASQVGAASTSPNVMQSYVMNVIRPHIMRHISHTRVNGVVTVTFAITRQGRLTAQRVSKSSGHSELDSAALATLQRAQPYPPPPPELGNQTTFNFVLPLRYN